MPPFMPSTLGRSKSDALVGLRIMMPPCFKSTLAPIEEEGKKDSAYADLSDRSSGRDTDEENGEFSSKGMPRRIWPGSLGSPGMGVGIIDFSPCSTEPSTPTSQNFDGESAPILSSQTPSFVSGQVSYFEKLLKIDAAFPLIAQAEQALLQQLRSVSVTLADVEALLHDARSVMASDVEKTPWRLLAGAQKIKQMFDNTNVNCNRRIMHALATSIASFHAQGRINDIELEEMLMHIVSADTELFNLVVAKIEREKQSCRCRIVPCPHRRRPLPVYSDFMDFVPQTGKGKKKMKLRTDYAEEVSGFFAVTRLHNGPGLQDRKCPVVNLPKLTKRRCEKYKTKGKVIDLESSDITVALDVQTQSPLDFSESIGIKVCLSHLWYPHADCTLTLWREFDHAVWVQTFDTRKSS